MRPLSAPEDQQVLNLVPTQAITAWRIHLCGFYKEMERNLACSETLSLQSFLSTVNETTLSLFSKVIVVKPSRMRAR